jgi:drug/metabolite transporter (DMT)-like permease
MEQSLPSSTLSSWGAACRPTLLFIAAYALSMTPHEAAHAFVAYLLGFSSTLFQLWVNPDAAQATTEQQALIAAAGPLFSVSVAAVCLMIYRKRRHKPSGLAFLMLGTVGIYIFLGDNAGDGLDLPIVTLSIRQLEFFLAVSLLKTTRERPHFFVCRFCFILCKDSRS